MIGFKGFKGRGRNSSPSRNSLSGLLAIFLLYGFIVTLMLILSFQLLHGFEFQQNVVLWVVLGIAIMLPVVLVLSVGFQVFKLLVDRRNRRPGAGYRLKMLAGFSILILLAAIPQGILALNFIRTGVSTWFRPDLMYSLEGGLSLAVEYYQQESRRLEDFSQSEIVRNVLRTALDDPDRALGLLMQFRPELAALQLVDNSGLQLGFIGPSAFQYDIRRLLQEPYGRLVRVSLVNRDVIRLKVPVPSAQNPLGALLMSLEISPDFEYRARNLQRSLLYVTQFTENQALFTFGVVIFYGLFSIPLILVAMQVSFFLSNQMVHPIMNLEAATKKVAEGDFSYRILSRRAEDLDHLTTSFNAMISELEKSRNRLVHSERIAAWKDMAQRLAHEIKNPLTPIKLSAERLVKKYDQASPDYGDVLQRSVKTIMNEVDRLDMMLTEFRNFARLPHPEPVEFPLLPMVREFQDLYQNYPNIRIDISGLSDNTMMYGDPKQIRQVLGNLIKNSIEAFQYSGSIKLGAFRVSKADREFCRIILEDDGPGLPPDVPIFTPYYTTKPNGTGLGLAIVERIIGDHSGKISYESTPGAGVRFYLDFPLA